MLIGNKDYESKLYWEKLGSILCSFETKIMNQNDTGKKWAAFCAYLKLRL